MTTREAKRDLLSRLMFHEVTFDKMTAHTTSFEDLARGSKVFVRVTGAQFPTGVTHDDVTPPKGTGYIVQWGNV